MHFYCGLFWGEVVVFLGQLKVIIIYHYYELHQLSEFTVYKYLEFVNLNLTSKTFKSFTNRHMYWDYDFDNIINSD